MCRQATSIRRGAAWCGGGSIGSLRALPAVFDALRNGDLGKLALDPVLARQIETHLEPYRLLVPRTPTQIDVLFLIDSTGSMGPVIDALKTGIGQIASALGRNGAGLDIHIGIGDFRDYPAPDGPGQPGDWPWRLDQGVRAITPALS